MADRRWTGGWVAAALAAWCLVSAGIGQAAEVLYFPVPEGSHPHDVAPARDGSVWYTAQHRGALGRLDPGNGAVEEVPLGEDSAPHGVIVGPDQALWVTDGGLNAILRVDPATRIVQRFALPRDSDNANLNTAVFDRDRILWFTGQNGIYGRLIPATGALRLWEAPRGTGPYGITAVASGSIYYASLAGNYLGRIDPATGAASVLEPPTRRQGARRAWADGLGRVWISEWNAGQLTRYAPDDQSWRTWKLPGQRPRAYAVYVDETDRVWVSDFGANAILRFDPASERFEAFPSDRDDAEVRQLAGRPGEVWGAESATDRLVVIRYGLGG